MDEQESEFRKREALKPFSPRFGGPFSYLMQGLRCDLADKGRVGQAQSHARQIRTIVTDFREELKMRGFSSEADGYHIRLVLTGLNLLEAIMRDDCSTQEKQDEFDLIYDGIALPNAGHSLLHRPYKLLALRALRARADWC
jgi:hypothetical protein